MKKFKFTKEWQSYPGFYEKEFFDIQTATNTYTACWPNSGKFCQVDTGIYIKEEDVLHIRFTHDKRFQE